MASTEPDLVQRFIVHQRWASKTWPTYETVARRPTPVKAGHCLGPQCLCVKLAGAMQPIFCSVCSTGSEQVLGFHLGTPRATQWTRRAKFGVFPEDFDTWGHFSALAQGGNHREICLPSALFWLWAIGPKVALGSSPRVTQQNSL
jgi:hypothetical protein